MPRISPHPSSSAEQGRFPLTLQSLGAQNAPIRAQNALLSPAGWAEGLRPSTRFFSRLREFSLRRGGRRGAAVSPSRSRTRPRWGVLALVLRSPSTARAPSLRAHSLPRFHFYLETSFAPVRRKGLTPPPLEGSADSKAIGLAFGKKKRPTF